MTITTQQAIDTIIAAVPGAPFPKTIDTVKCGDTSQELTSIIVTFLATGEVIEQAVRLGANLIITHEPTFYNHRDDTEWLRADDVYQSKRKLIEENHLVIWRFHDYLHSIPPDSTLMGLLKELNWKADDSTSQTWAVDIQPMTLLEIGQHIKERLGIQSIRMVGDPTSVCRRVGLVPGFYQEMQMKVLGSPDIDVLIAGEIHEWEVSEYVRDASHFGFKKGLIVIGHAASEEPGMRYVISWLKEQLPGVSFQFVPTGTPFRYL